MVLTGKMCGGVLILVNRLMVVVVLVNRLVKLMRQRWHVMFGRRRSMLLLTLIL